MTQNKLPKDTILHPNIWSEALLDAFAYGTLGQYMGIPIVSSPKCATIKGRLLLSNYGSARPPISEDEVIILCWEALLAGHTTRRVLDELELRVTTTAISGEVYFDGYEDGRVYGPFSDMGAVEAAILLYAGGK